MGRVSWRIQQARATELLKAYANVRDAKSTRAHELMSEASAAIRMAIDADDGGDGEG